MYAGHCLIGEMFAIFNLTKSVVLTQVQIDKRPTLYQR